MMQKRLSEVRSLIASEDFQQWWQQWVNGRNALADAEAKYDELLAQSTLMDFRAELTQKNAIDMLYRAGEAEDTAATMLVEADELENRSFRGVSDFEEQRYKVSELWYRLGAVEKERDEAIEDKWPAEPLQDIERAHRMASNEYEKEMARKARLWDEVERLWARGAEVSLLVAEKRMQSRKGRKDAEGLFALAGDRKKRSKDLRAEVERVGKELEDARTAQATWLHVAKERFGCMPGGDFLYFRQKDDNKLAHVISLVDDVENYNIEVKPLAVYMVDRQRGVSFLEPARAHAPPPEEGDQRFEAYFLKGRKGRSAPGAMAH